MRAVLVNVLSLALMASVLGLGVFALLHSDQAGAADRAPKPVPIVSLLLQRDGCPSGQMRAYFSASATEIYPFCWRLDGDQVELFDHSRRVTTMPARWFARTEQAQ